MKKLPILLILCFVNLSAQSFSGGFTFNLPATDTSSTLFLPSFPAHGIAGDEFVGIDPEGHFSVKGNPIRFWGGNVVFGAAFPDTGKVWFIAGRLRQMGFNLIRFHHIDNGWVNESLFYPGDNEDTRHFNLNNLDRMERLIAELKKNSIYINMNLNVSRDFKVNDGVENADSLVEMAKGVTQFDPYLIELQKEYAQELLTHVNPYTGLALKDDPVLAMVEVANENSLYRIWRDNKLKLQSQGGWLILRHVEMLNTMWNKYLADKYTTTANLAAAWDQGVTSGSSSNQVKNGDFESGSTANWAMEKHTGTEATLLVDVNNPYKGSSSAKVLVTKVGANAYNLQFKQISILAKQDSFYTIEFAARSDGNRRIHAAFMKEYEPWNYYAGQDIALSTGWNVYSFSFKFSESTITDGRLTFQFYEPGTFWFDEISMGKPPVSGLLEGESLEAKNVKRLDFSECLKFTDNRIKDISDFYIQLQTKYFNEMRDFLKTTLGLKVPIVGTNWNVGAADLSIQSTMDYIDNHSYWDHPSFPNEPWSATDWTINNTAMVKNPDGGTMAHLFADAPIEGKPYTISEYNHAFPNRYQAEAPLFISAYSSFHYADGIMFFDYNGGNDWESDKVSSYFSIHRNNALMSLMPSCAYAFRNNLIAKAKETLLINYTHEKIKLLPKDDPGGWLSYSPYPKQLALVHAIRTQSFHNSSTTDFSSFPPQPISPFKTDTDEIIYNTNGLLTVNAPKFAGFAGTLSTFTNSSAGNLTLKAANEFGVITWLSLTDDSLSKADKSLITVSSRIQNTGMKWDGTNTIHNNWGSTPTLIQPLSLTLELNIQADSIRVYRLDNAGRNEASSYRSYLPSSANKFTIIINQNIDKSLWFGIQKYGNGSPTAVEEESTLPLKFGLEQNYPNPFNPNSNFGFRIAELGYVTLKVYDVLGKHVATIVDEEKSPGRYNVNFDASNLSSGVYYYTLKAGSSVETKKMVVLK